MNKRPVRYFIIFFAYLAVLYPVWMRVKTLDWGPDAHLLYNISPIFGLSAFAILWLHVMSGVFEKSLRRYINFDQFVRNTSILVFAFIILHPLLTLIDLDFSRDALFSYGKKYIWLGIIGWLLLITYDIGKVLNKFDFFSRNWNKILLISTIGFLLTFFHSLGIGSDLQSGPLRVLWIFYGVTAIIGTVYIYGVRRFWR